MSGASSSRRVLLIPSVLRGNGTGHLRRCFGLAAGLSGKGRIVSVLVIPGEAGGSSSFSRPEIDAVFNSMNRSGFRLTENPDDEYDLCIFDMRETSERLFSAYSGRSFCIGIDEGGSRRPFFDYLIDILPNLQTIPANISSIGFLNLPPEAGSRQRACPPQKILVSFGGEDSAGLTAGLWKMLESEGFFRADQLTVVRGPLFAENAVPDGLNILDAPENLGKLLADYDLVFTMFGITCFEALHCGTPVILLNPSRYHRQLAERAGIPEIGVLEPEPRKLKSLLSSAPVLYDAVRRYSSVETEDLPTFIMGLDPVKMHCRFCGTPHAEIIQRSEKRIFFECSECGLVNMYDFRKMKTEYGTDYFFEDYRNQYGRTYLEDFENIKKAGMRRCEVIAERLEKPGSLLDIGCGYGPFLSAASDTGFEVYGIDISENAVKWVDENLGFPAAAADAASFSPGIFGRERFNAVTMWYVIEHMEKLPGILQRINMMIEPGGVFAFATPNYSGVSGRRSSGAFLESSPDDHYTVWNTASARKIMELSGFRVFAVRCPVIHPARFFKEERYGNIPGFLRRIIDPVARAAGRLMKLGDTFEVYCVKAAEAASDEI